jgi:hypothetical protein
VQFHSDGWSPSFNILMAYSVPDGTGFMVEFQFLLPTFAPMGQGIGKVGLLNYKISGWKTEKLPRPAATPPEEENSLR